jgi:hypothetical protein
MTIMNYNYFKYFLKMFIINIFSSIIELIFTYFSLKFLDAFIKIINKYKSYFESLLICIVYLYPI